MAIAIPTVTAISTATAIPTATTIPTVIPTPLALPYARADAAHVPISSQPSPLPLHTSTDATLATLADNAVGFRLQKVSEEQAEYREKLNIGSSEALYFQLPHRRRDRLG